MSTVRGHYNLCTFLGSVQTAPQRWLTRTSNEPYLVFDLAVTLGTEKPTFLKCTILPLRLVEFAQRYLSPGVTVLISGRLTTYKGRYGKAFIQKWGLNVEKFSVIMDTELIVAQDESMPAQIEERFAQVEAAEQDKEPQAES